MNIDMSRNMKEGLESIIEKIETLDHSMRIAMLNEDRQKDPLVRFWLNSLLDIDEQARRLLDGVGCCSAEMQRPGA